MLEVGVVMKEGEGGEDDDGGRRQDGGDGGGSGGGDRSSNGHRWPRQETMALLKIRSDMDVMFKESGLKGPLWEDVSRKMAGFGYQRNAKKCKEKFENIYKYHKRTKEGRAMKKDGRNYRFSDQLEALAPHHHHLNLPQQQQQHQQILSPEKAVLHHEVPQLLSMMTTSITANPAVLEMSTHQSTANPPSLIKDFTTSTTSSSFSSGEESEGTRRRKRKMESFFENLMKDVMEKQENLQKKFLEVMEKRERERMVREESWKMQEIARMNREHEILAQERAMAAARDAAVMAFLNKISEQSNQISSTSATTTHQLRENPSPLMEKTTELDNNNTQSNINGDHNQSLAPMVTMGAPSSRWPKLEVEALISLRTELDRKYIESSQKGPLWEEVSSGMKRLGYDRNAKKCKEKWENINKYYKKVRDKRRAEDSKTCPYYDQLDALYKERMVMSHSTPIMPTVNLTSSSVGNKGSEERAMQIVNHQPQQQQLKSSKGVKESSVLQDKGFSDHDDNTDDIDDDDDDDGDEDEASEYEIAVNSNNASSIPIVE
ncbi:hypothetical protein Sjap_018551 [Stephania japonica]|uniref:Myb-like domain-containing protein n=1 Tax=Stephania japonica TaxID=461633 RepID=A0AAP0I8Z9_9MAGN